MRLQLHTTVKSREAQPRSASWSRCHWSHYLVGTQLLEAQYGFPWQWETPGGQRLRGSSHIHGLYLQYLHQLLMVKSWERSLPSWLWQLTTIVKYAQYILHNEGLFSRGKYFARTLFKVSSQHFSKLSPCRGWSRDPRNTSWRSQPRDTWPLKYWALFVWLWNACPCLYLSTIWTMH